MFFKGSRYENVDEVQITDSRGRVVRFKKVRFIPETRARFAHALHQGERLDQIAHRYFQDSERFWRIADANRAMWPEDLLAEAGRLLLIPPSEG